MSTTEMPRQFVTSLVEDAATAPSMHNAQPWKFVHRTGADTIELYGDPDRTMPYEDPDHRALHLGCGAALFNLRVAAAHRGLPADTRLLPDPDDPWHLADVLPRPTDRQDDGLESLHPALRLRHTSRFPFSEERIPSEVTDELCAAALLEGCRLVVPGTSHTETLLDLFHDSEILEAANEAVRKEIATWTRTGAGEESAETEGIPSYAFGPRQYDVTSPVRDFDSHRHTSDRVSAVFERRPQIALLGTADDAPEDWLKAGQALQRVLLRATLDGLSTSLMSQPLEWPDLRSMARDPVSAMGFVQMVIRLGYGPAGRATPRRPVSEVLSFV